MNRFSLIALAVCLALVAPAAADAKCRGGKGAKVVVPDDDLGVAEPATEG